MDVARPKQVYNSQNVSQSFYTNDEKKKQTLDGALVEGTTVSKAE